MIDIKTFFFLGEENIISWKEILRRKNFYNVLYIIENGKTLLGYINNECL